jgi:hypothetical protein
MSRRLRRPRPRRRAIFLRPSSRYRLTIAMRIEVDYAFLLAGPRTSHEVMVDRKGRFQPPDIPDLLGSLESQFRPCSQSRQLGWVVWFECLTHTVVDPDVVKVMRQIGDNVLDEHCWLRLIGSVAAELELELRRLEAEQVPLPSDPFGLFSGDDPRGDEGA